MPGVNAHMFGFYKKSGRDQVAVAQLVLQSLLLQQPQDDAQPPWGSRTGLASDCRQSGPPKQSVSAGHRPHQPPASAAPSPARVPSCTLHSVPPSFSSEFLVVANGLPCARPVRISVKSKQNQDLLAQSIHDSPNDTDYQYSLNSVH